MVVRQVVKLAQYAAVRAVIPCLVQVLLPEEVVVVQVLHQGRMQGLLAALAAGGLFLTAGRVEVRGQEHRVKVLLVATHKQAVSHTLAGVVAELLLLEL